LRSFTEAETEHTWAIIIINLLKVFYLSQVFQQAQF